MYRCKHGHVCVCIYYGYIVILYIHVCYCHVALPCMQLYIVYISMPM